MFQRITNLLGEGEPLPQWVSDTFLTVQAVLVSVMALSCIVIIIAVLSSPPQTGTGNNAITGAAESYYTKNKGRNNAGRIQILIVCCAVLIAICAICYFISYAIYTGGR